MSNFFEKPMMLISSLIRRFNLLSYFASALLLYSCSNEDDNFMNANKQDSKVNEQTDPKSDKLTNDLIQSIPSPVEMASLIKSSGGAFNSQLVSKAGNLERFKDSYEKAINMGVFVADLGYINIHEQTMHSLSYLNAIKRLADELKVGQFFDFETLKRLSSNSSNADSLLHISTSNFNKMDEYLRMQNRSELSALIITGAWLEGLHLATNITKQKPSKDLYERVGEQKINIESILEVVNSFQENKYLADLGTNLKELKSLFDGVQIDYEYAEPTQKEVDGKLVMVDNSKTVVKITAKQVEDITELTDKIRANITK